MAAGVTAAAAGIDGEETAPPGRLERLLARAAAKTWGLPAPRNAVTVTRDIRIPMADGVTLLADHYAPATSGASAGNGAAPPAATLPAATLPAATLPAPTVLVRTPYGRGLPASLQDAQLIAERGYHVLYVSCRGTFGSGGEFDPGRHEASDGQDCVAWLREREWFDGRLFTFGMSYLGYTQWALAMDPPPELRASVVLVGLHDFGRSVHSGGTFSLYNTLSWAGHLARDELAGPGDGLVRFLGGERRLLAAMSGDPLTDGARTLLRGRSRWYERWMNNTDPADPYWDAIDCTAALEKTGVPVLLVGGWQDLFLRQTMEQYRVLTRRGVPARLIVGPWAHLDVPVKGGGIVMRETLAWLDRHAAPEAEPITPTAPASTTPIPSPTTTSSPSSASGLSPAADPSSTSPVRVFVGGAGWRDLPEWPPAESVSERWALCPDGMLVVPPVSGAGGGPAADGPAAGGPAAGGKPGEGEARFRYDPADPTPTVGGAIMGRSAGVRDNRAVEARPDVLVFTSVPLTRPVEIAGAATAEVAVARDNPHADVFVRLCDVDRGGRSRNVCDAIIRLGAADPLDGVVTLNLAPAAHRFAAGHRIRVQVSGGAHPRFARNPGTGEVDAAPADLRDTRYRVRAGSAITLPVLP